MAGIGFRLQKILRKGTYRSLVAAYFYSAMISTGPWLISIAGIAVLSALATSFVEIPELLTFRAIVVYAYLGSLVLTGPFQMGTTRYIADRLFVNDTRALAPCFHFTAVLSVIACGVLGILFWIISWLVTGMTISVSTATAGIVIFQAASLIWTTMIFLSAAKDYIAIVRAFALGYALSVALALVGASEAGLPGMTWGFATGQAILFWLLAVRIRIEFPSERPYESVVVDHWRQMPMLFWIGLTYNLGIWIDKIVFWCGPSRQSIRDLLYAAPDYDTCIFLGYLSIIPAMALFLIRIETGFYKRYAAFYTVVTQGGSLSRLEDAKEQMTEALQLSVVRLLKLQGVFSLFLILAAPTLGPWIGLGPHLTPLFRIAILAAFLQVMLLILIILILYFDWQREAMKVSVLFCASNFFFTLASQYLDARYHGFGYLLACLLALCYGLQRMEVRMRKIEYETFTQQPIRS